MEDAFKESGIPKADVPKRLAGALLDEALVSAILSFFSVGTLGLAYFIGQDCIGGQSAGRRLMKQKLIDIETGETVAPAKAAMRNFVGFLLAVTTVGIAVDLVLIVVREDGRRIADLMFRTQVVDVAEAAELERAISAPSAPADMPPQPVTF